MKRHEFVFFTRAAAIVVLASVAAFGQGTTVEHRYTANVGFGVTPNTGALSDRLNTGWHFTAGGSVNLGTIFGVNGQFTYNGFGVNRAVLNNFGVPGGDAHLFSITADPFMRLGALGRFQPYVVGGVGYYRRTVNFTQPTLATIPLFDPFFGVVFPGVTTANQIVGQVNRDGIGGSLGGGFSMGLARDLKFFTEARYHYADTGPVPTRMIPVTFGVRW